MGTRRWRVAYIRLANGTSPFLLWFEKLADPIARARLLARLERLTLGNFGDSKSLNHGLFELRVNVGPGYRVYFGISGPEFIMVIYGGTKATQAKDIQRAKAIWTAFKGDS
jgi:putative addiction module killer protein